MGNFKKTEKITQIGNKAKLFCQKIAKVNLCDLLQHFMTLITSKLRQDLKDLQLPR